MYKKENEFLSVQEVAERLNLHEQTVYRKCARGELPTVRFGRTIRIPKKSLSLATPSLRKKREVSLPSFMHRYFWDYDVGKLTLPNPLIFERILELGDLPEIVWLRERVGVEELRSFVRTKGGKKLSARSRQFWRKMLGMSEENHEPTNSSQETKGSLGKTRWR